MPARHHEVPTHLNVEDKVLFGLTVRQFLYLLVGSSATYTLWGQFSAAPDALRVGFACFGVVCTLAFALFRPGGRALEEWLVAALFYFATPRAATWRAPEPEPSHWRPASAAWQELTPDAVWADGEAA